MNLKYMKIALKEALKAYKKGEVPVGCVIVKNNKILAKAHNLKEKKKNALKHAELIAIEKASKKNNNWRLNDCDIYITLEPCPMCASAIQQARINNIYCGLNQKDNKNSNIVTKILEKNDTNKEIKIYNNLMPLEVEKIMQDFFKNQRKK